MVGVGLYLVPIQIGLFQSDMPVIDQFLQRGRFRDDPAALTKKRLPLLRQPLQPLTKQSTLPIKPKG